MKNLIVVCFTIVFAFGCNSQKKVASNQGQASQEKPANNQGQMHRQGERKARPSINEIFKMDTNNDGKLSKSEIQGPLQNDFENIDSDGDGFISRMELENAPKPERRQGRLRN